MYIFPCSHYVQRRGVRKRNRFADMPDIHCIYSIIIDIMHNLYRGVVLRMLKCTLGKKQSLQGAAQCNLSEKALAAIEEKFKGFKRPAFVNRSTRSFEFKYWKGNSKFAHNFAS